MDIFPLPEKKICNWQLRSLCMHKRNLSKLPELLTKQKLNSFLLRKTVWSERNILWLSQQRTPCSSVGHYAFRVGRVYCATVSQMWTARSRCSSVHNSGAPLHCLFLPAFLPGRSRYRDTWPGRLLQFCGCMISKCNADWARECPPVLNLTLNCSHGLNRQEVLGVGC